MLALPIPMIVALVLGFLFLRALLTGDRPYLFCALLTVCAVQSVVVSLHQHYGIAALLAVQPVTATVIPPLAWVAFQATAIRAFDPARDAVHFAVPVFTAFCIAFAPDTLDVVVPAVFLAYGGAILLRLRQGPDGLPLIRLETGPLPGLVWSAIALALILSAVSDGLIAIALATGRGWLQPWIVSLLSSAALFSIGLLSLSQSVVGTPDERTAPQVPRPDTGDPVADKDLMARLDALLRDSTLYLDPGLTLARLARRLQVPAKQLSATINRATGDNVSRYVNGFRIAHACERLRAGDSVTAAMLASGFNTKSNFNREFARVTGMNPSAWQARDTA